MAYFSNIIYLLANLKNMDCNQDILIKNILTIYFFINFFRDKLDIDFIDTIILKIK